ncbi:MAG: hypothetical protein NWF03_01325 [Candidatus Bathyarchaeota archaeon]|nr:hypothetical protein [Candidatus Bathyarchaeota archaeon]
MKDQTMMIAYATLFAGIALLAFTFISAYSYLATNPAITGSSDLVNAFGSSLAPLIEAAIRIMYLGVMGWIGSGLTVRGVQLITKLKQLDKIPLVPKAPTGVKPLAPTGVKENKDD